MKTHFLFFWIAFFLGHTALGWGVKVTQVETVSQYFPRQVRGYNLTVSWEHSWHTDKNHDAAWVILKSLKERGYTHVPLKMGSATMRWKDSPDMPDAKLEVPEDGAGLFVYTSEKYRGRLKYGIFVELDTAKLGDGKVMRGKVKGYGIEMVYVPEGAFTLGDPDTARSLNYYAFYRSGAEGTYDGLYKIESEDQAIEVGAESNKLYYRSDRAVYRGDQQGPIPADFPKGYQAFYLMKYEVRQGDYVNFLNTLSPYVASLRYTSGTPKYRKHGGTIRMDDETFVADRPEQRMIYWHWDDMTAFYDWAGLRPYTEFEFTKAVRGPRTPIPHEMAWNTDNVFRLARKPNPETNYMEMNQDIPLDELSDENRVAFGASYYWIFDLNGSMWEKVITPGDSVGRAFTGEHGDGNISYYGFADVAEWPSGFRDSEGGYGYRGGGYYSEPWISGVNPYQPIAYRPYASWSAGPRRDAYGGRAARTAPKEQE